MMDNHIWHLISRKLSGEASLEELRELQQLLNDDPEMAYKAELYTGFFEHPLQQQRSDEQKTDSWSSLQSKLTEAFPENFGNNIVPDEPARPVFAVYKKWVAIAASLVLITVAGIYFLQHDKREKQLAGTATNTNEMNTMPGTRSKTVLPDGTVVWLNSDSRITYNADFGQTQREVTLTGEAFFDVAHNAEVPMTVHAKNVNIRVKGTAFNVRSYPESRQVETSLIRGAVELTTNADPERKIMLKPNEKIVVDVPEPDSVIAIAAKFKKARASISVVTSRNLYHIEQLKESRFNIIPEISWVQNRLVFDNEVFTEVISKMEKWYNVKIILENNTLAVKNFSGAFEKEDITTALQALQLINDFHFEIKDRMVYIK
jgi:ferric-dicitrate binding protein FerR (iron transport regulator)